MGYPVGEIRQSVNYSFLWLMYGENVVRRCAISFTDQKILKDEKVSFLIFIVKDYSIPV